MGLPARLPILAEVDGEEFALPAGTDPLAVLEALAAGSWWAVFRLMDTEETLGARLADHRDRFSLVQARDLAKGVAEALTGYRWHTACVLAASAVRSWSEFDGLCAYRGFDPWSAPVARTLAMVHHCLMAGCKDDVERAYLAYQLDGEEAVSDGGHLASLESSNFAEWNAAFGPDGTLLRKSAITA